MFANSVIGMIGTNGGKMEMLLGKLLPDIRERFEASGQMDLYKHKIVVKSSNPKDNVSYVGSVLKTRSCTFDVSIRVYTKMLRLFVPIDSFRRCHEIYQALIHDVYDGGVAIALCMSKYSWDKNATCVTYIDDVVSSATIRRKENRSMPIIHHVRHSQGPQHNDTSECGGCERKIIAAHEKKNRTYTIASSFMDLVMEALPSRNEVRDLIYIATKIPKDELKVMQNSIDAVHNQAPRT